MCVFSQIISCLIPLKTVVIDVSSLLHFGLRPATLLKKRLWHRCFPVNFAKFLKALFCRKPPDDCFWIEKENHFWISNFNPPVMLEQLKNIKLIINTYNISKVLYPNNFDCWHCLYYCYCCCYCCYYCCCYCCYCYCYYLQQSMSPENMSKL